MRGKNEQMWVDTYEDEEERMIGLEPLVTVYAGTGAFRTITSDLLAETYLAPRPQTINLNAVLADEAFPWSASMEVAPVETAAAVSAALRSVTLATSGLRPDEIDLACLDPDTRLYRHLAALCDLWRQAPAALAENLQVYTHVLSCTAADALEQLPLVAADLCSFATPIERRLHAHLLAHHGLADEAFRKEWAARRAPLLAGAPEGTSLWRAQQGLTGATIPSGPLDETLAFFALRDEAEEADFAAARTQRLIDQGVSPADIGLLVPDEVGYFAHLRRAFDDAGVPISGLPDQPARRDIAGETLLHLLLCLQAPAPAMALTSLYISPLMPWPAETGLQLSREIMQGRFEPFAARSLTGRAQRFYALVRNPVAQTPAGILQALEQAAQLLTKASEHREDVAAFHSKLAALRAVLSQSNALDWTPLFRLATPTTPKPTPSEAFVEGVSVFTEGAVPWRPARHLIAMGMSGNRWPRSVSASPLFLDGELRLLREKTGLQIETRGDTLARHLEKLRRQFLSASESLTLLRPVFAPNGGRQPAAAALSLVARTVGNGQKRTEDAEALIHDLRSIPRARWPFAHSILQTTTEPQTSALPKDGLLRLGRDLLRRRLADDGRMRPQSPSRLETLLVSPLAWSLSEFRAEPVTWAPDGLNVMVSGTITHDVLEFLFPKDAPLPDHDQIEEAVPELLTLAIRKYAPFLQRSIWAVEREGLQRDIRNAAHVWRDTLEGLGARVIDNEINLRGEALGILLRGRADCLLQIADGSLLVVDHKKSGTAKRRARLEAGWDLQLGLYRAMLMRPEKTGEVLEAALAGSPKIGVAYHLINDQGVLLEGLEPPDGVVTVMTGEISASAMGLLITRLAEVGSGVIRLNSEGDRSFFEKTANLAPYALDASPLVSRFMMPGTETTDSMEGING
ncbi:PD-(D/E)XK nuclease family protein [Antarcticimicrobium sediminis]|uniref:PD-(D/E)XK nuclease family protein n=1 Tax=Antarcticimicrobium sediminis TaxID=2546227 RepID=A0A4V6PG97_9RHOB|nr:PD-(D/E)XK nuclease family protein [Antarcticimicrobium sediminis]TDE40006.1 PD-(D/E)XK nuclease family protein [Antarcticimicrobium sediminis]